MVEGGHDREDALRRVARQHGIKLQQAIPPIEALHTAIHDYRELFKPEQLVELEERRRLALQAMAEFAEFQPRLFGALLHGDGALDLVQLMVFADSPEQLMHHLSDRHIPWQESERVLHYSGGRRIARPALRFLAGEATVELAILDPGCWSDPPRDALTGRRLEMQGVDELNALIARAQA